MKLRNIVLATALSAAPGLLHAQFDFKIADKDFQVHSFASQGFAYSNNNNYLSMDTSSGSFSMTDFGANISTQLTDRFRVGAQIYDRNVGKIGNWRPELDFAVADYRFRDWFGIRGGKVKTALGLSNDTQDLEFLHTWALMPQSVYPMDERGDTIAHVGGDLYGNIGIKRLGSWAYTVYGGQRQSDMESGYVYGLETSTLVNGVYVLSAGKKIDSYGGPVYGADLRWTTPLKGLLAGASYMKMDITARGSYLSNGRAFNQYTLNDNTIATYVQYSLGNFTFAGEYRKQVKNGIFDSPTGSIVESDNDTRQGYVSAAYRISKRLEVGSYHSRFIKNWLANHGDPMNHIFDRAVTVRVDLNRYVDFKVEGHFIDGAMVNNYLPHGFFTASNPSGLKPQMNMLVMRVGFHI